MEEIMEMEVEEEQQQQQLPSSSNHNQNNLITKFGLKNSIQTNFGDDYVFEIALKDDWTSMAVSLSTNAVKLYSPVTGQYYGECKGHSATINQISFYGALLPHILHSCSSDGTIRAWDTRTFQQVSCIEAGSDNEIFNFSFGGSTGNLLAGGSNSQVLLWDWRNQRQVACLEESHMDDVTQVHFVPDQQSKLVSASVDGLICIFDTQGDINEDDHLESVINVGTSIGKVGFFGDSYRKLWCLTHIESLSVWDWKDAVNEANFENARALASDSWTFGQVDYFVDCHSSDNDTLWAIGGSNAGTIGYFPVNYAGAKAIGSPEAVLGGGHTGVIRSVLPISIMSANPAQSQGIFGWSGGEDGRLCCWTSDNNNNNNSHDVNRSWISSNLVMKSSKNRQKNRHNPY